MQVHSDKITTGLLKEPLGGAVAYLPRTFGNQLLAALPLGEFRPWLSQLDLVDLPLGSVLYEAGRAQPYVYFPTTAVVSLLYVTLNGSSAETAVVGHEGVVGVSLFMGGETSPCRALVRNAGQGYRLRARALQEAFNSSATTRRLLLRYAQALMTQVSQMAVCNRHHSVEKQLCRWLLMTLDRLPDNHLRMTQEMISTMLGVRREGVTEHANKLQNAGLIRYTRGHIEVLDRQGLEERVCECYRVVKKECDRLLPHEVTG
ncbi:MAG: Crp/Fnr family transcriptional regulator [Hylemonella sp.]